ncbi:GMC family oxidoreductase N-terminal domain-containing protein [soil metagenome]
MTRTHRHDQPSSASFDYVIAGAGSAGCVLANRLSADPRISVCLIEAGPADRSPLIHVPIGMASLYNHAKLNWRYQTVPQKLANDRVVYTPRGKVLGGSSAINGMVYMRGHPHDYDDWAAAGNEGWAFEDVLPYFLKSENNEVWRDSPLHGTGGPLNVCELRTRNSVADRFIEAGRMLGFPACDDFNGLSPEGVGYRQVTQRNGRRESAATAFLAPVRRRPNLCVVTNAHVDSIELDGLRAVGVRYVSDGEHRVVRARAEVVLSGGAVGSPLVLQRSGIGDADYLASRDIPVVAHLPGVGQNLQDHPAVSLSYATSSTEPYGISVKVLPRLAWGVLQYLFFRRGLLSSNVLEAAGYIRTESSIERPDIQFSFMSARRGGSSRKGSPSTQFGYGHGYGATAILLRPKSKGSVRVAARDANVPPQIDGAFFSDGRDLDVLLRGLKLGRRLLNAQPFERYKARELLPGSELQSDDALREFIRANSGTAFHPVGTCAMGRSSDSVVSPELRVHGIDRLRVVDASVMPSIVGGNTNAPTIMIAEKASDMILRAAHR